jgi:uncharacterized membrane protein
MFQEYYGGFKNIGIYYLTFCKVCFTIVKNNKEESQMTAATYGTLMRIIAFALAALIAVSIVLELPLYVPVLVIMVALLIAGILRRRVKELMADERNLRIYERATAASYRVYTILAAGTAFAAMMLRSSLPEWAFVAGQTLAYSICALMLIHLALVSYYEKKL